MIKFLDKIDNTEWDDIGVFPTPNTLVDQFCEFVIEHYQVDSSTKIDLLDIFCGDGRLGVSLGENMVKNNFNLDYVTFVEVMKESLAKVPNEPNYIKRNTNVFQFNPTHKFEVVVSNPPYLVLNSNKSNDLGINWDFAKENSKNLYALSILKGLELCKPGGLLAVIAPFGYLRGYFSDEFKIKLENVCERIIVKAQKERNIFDGVNQDIGFQLFFKKPDNNKNSKTSWEFGYNGYKLKKINDLSNSGIKVNQLLDENKKSINVRVGPIVWNRSKEDLKTKKTKHTSTLIYGSNIKSDNSFDFKVPKLYGKQYIKSSAIAKTDIVKSPAILLRRTMRGKPGKWIIDSAILKEDGFTAENHTIVIELHQFKENEIVDFKNQIIEVIRDYYYISGSPTISTKVVNNLVQRTLIDFK